MSLLTATILQLLNHKTLEEEVIEALTSAMLPMTCAQILEQVVSQPDSHTLSREVHRLASLGIVEKAGEVTAPPGSFRKTVFTYRLRPSQAKSVPAGQAQAEASGLDSVPAEVLGLFERYPGAALTCIEIAAEINRTKGGVYGALQFLMGRGRLQFKQDGRTHRYFVLSPESVCQH